MDGAAPLSYATIEAWSRLTDTRVEPHEVDALLMLDAAIRHSEEPKEDAQEAAPRQTEAWPTKKQ